MDSPTVRKNGCDSPQEIARLFCSFAANEINRMETCANARLTYRRLHAR